MLPRMLRRSLVFAALWITWQLPLDAQAAPSAHRVGQVAFTKWLTEDVAYIIAPEERAKAGQLSTDAARYEFIEEFWMRRNPNPDAVENEFKEEHYRRLAYANEHFASRLPGWKTGRGRAYIMYGPPDELEARSGTQVWRYRYIEGLGKNLAFEFTLRDGEFILTKQPPPGLLRNTE
jgi:GWxTD domain-containing protein